MFECISNSFVQLAIKVRCKVVDTVEVLFSNYQLGLRNRNLRAKVTILEREKQQAEYCQRWAFSLFHQFENMLTDNSGNILQPAIVQEQKANIVRVIQNWEALQSDSNAKVWDLKTLTDDEVLSMAGGIVNNNPALGQLAGLQKGEPI